MFNAQEKVSELAAEVAGDLQLELVSVEVTGRGRRSMVRIVIDKEGGVTISDCEKMSRGLEALLDVEDPIPGTYMLEVGSPGLDRPLHSQRDYERSVGKLARIVTSGQVGTQTFFIGRIVDVGEGWIRLQIENKGGSTPQKGRKPGAVRGEPPEEIIVPLDKIAKARLEIE